MKYKKDIKHLTKSMMDGLKDGEMMLDMLSVLRTKDILI